MSPFRVGLLALTAFLLSGLSTAEAICPSKIKGPGGSLPPGIREPFDPPAGPAEPEDPPPGEDPADPTTPGSGPGTPSTPGSGPITPPTTGGPGGPVTGRGRGPRGLDAMDDAAWELWWGLNRADVLPRVQRQTDTPDGNYARSLPPELRGAVDLLIAGAGDQEPAIRQMCVGTFVGFVSGYRSKDTLDALRKATTEFDLYTRDLAHLALAARGDLESLPAIRKVLRSKGEMAVSRGFAALALIRLKDPKGMEDVADAVKDLEEAEVAGAALIGLGLTQDRAHVELLKDAAQRKAGSAVRLRRVRSDAIIALGKMGCPTAIPLLVEMLADKQKVICRSAALALGAFKGDAAAEQALREACVSHEDYFVRGFAAVSLGRIGAVGSLPAISKAIPAEKEKGVVPFLQLGVGLLREKTGALLLDEGLAEDPRTGRYASAALADGLLDMDEDSAQLKGALEDVRNTSAPACSALGLALMGERSIVADLRKRFWLDSARARPGFDMALALLDAEEQSKWIAGEIKRTKRNSTRSAFVDALSLCGGPAEGAQLAELYGTLSGSDNSLRISIIMALASILNDRTVTYPRQLMLHTHYLQSNIVLNHLAFLP